MTWHKPRIQSRKSKRSRLASLHGPGISKLPPHDPHKIAIYQVLLSKFRCLEEDAIKNSHSWLAPDGTLYSAPMTSHKTMIADMGLDEDDAKLSGMFRIWLYKWDTLTMYVDMLTKPTSAQIDKIESIAAYAQPDSVNIDVADFDPDGYVTNHTFYYSLSDALSGRNPKMESFP